MWIAAWAIIGVLALLIKALVVLVPYALEVRPASLTPVQLVFGIGWLAFMLYGEGYKGFHRAFAPRVVARALHLARHPRWYFVLIAPAYAMALVHAPLRRMAISWFVMAMVAVAVFVVRQLSQPWRGLVDIGVVAGLSWGTLSILWYSIRAATGRPPEVDPALPPPV